MRTRSGPVSPHGSARQRSLRGQGGGQRVSCPGEDGVDAIADRLEDHPAVRRNRLPHNSVVAGESRGHGLRLLLPEPCATRDVGKEEGDGTHRERRRYTLGRRRSGCSWASHRLCGRVPSRCGGCESRSHLVQPLESEVGRPAQVGAAHHPSVFAIRTPIAIRRPAPFFTGREAAGRSR